jgi:hypothetical protein
MGTKNNPGYYDCWEKAEPDEPLFVLLARDPLAPFLVSIWSKIRMGDIQAANVVFETMMTRVGLNWTAEPDAAKATEAIECSLAMFRWQEEKREK